jgi:hypothetical protein
MPLGPYTQAMADEDTVLEEAMDNLKEAGQRIRATQSLMRSQGKLDDADYRELVSRLTALITRIDSLRCKLSERRGYREAG